MRVRTFCKTHRESHHDNSKLFALAGLILTLTLPSALLAGSVNGADWYSVEPGKTTNQIEQVIALDSSVARTGIGVDWHDGGEMMFMKPVTELSLRERTFFSFRHDQQGEWRQVQKQKAV